MLILPLIFMAAPLSANQPAGSDLTDRSVSDAVEDELLFDQAVNSLAIDVSTANGIVTLSGSVDNALAKDRAARVAEAVKGVRAVVNNIKVQPWATRSATAIEADVKAALALNPATDSWDIAVTAANDGTVELTGTVDSWQERELATKVAKGVKGVTEVENSISFIPAIERPDAELKAEIEQALRWDVLVDHALIDVNVAQGRVELTGTVGSAAEKRRATADAYVGGVKEVDNSALAVERWARDPDLRKGKYTDVTDAQVREAVQDALRYDPRVRLPDVRVAANDGVVTLRGAVDSLAAKRAAAEDARRTVGVSAVINRIRVVPDAVSADADIAQHIRSALVRDPYVESYELSVSVLGGVARLNGNVDTYFEKARADGIASRTPGVVSVINNIVVRNVRAPLAYDPFQYDPPPGDYPWYDYQPYYSLKADAEIERDIEGELWWSPFVDSSDVDVEVNNGVATLTGTVNSWAEAQDARQNAYEGGATWVINKVRVQPKEV